MELTHKRSFKNLFSFIRAVLINESEKENKNLLLDYTIDQTFNFDAYSFAGLNIFELGDGPQYIIIGYNSMRNFIKVISNNRDFEFLKYSKVIVITNKTSRYKTENVINGITLYIFGRAFINECINYHHISYLNYLLGEENIRLEVINREKDRDRISDLEWIEVSSDDEKYYIHDDTPYMLSLENERLFKTLLNSSENSHDNKCAIFLGNGVSIPYGADDWQSLINNLIDYLKPFYIDDNERVKVFLSNSSYAISSFVKTTLEDSKEIDKYYDALYYCVYRKVNEHMFKENTLVRAVALGKVKYPNLPLLTYNYDTFVEHQYEIESKKQLLHILPSDSLLKNPDVLVHLHGYIGFHSHMAHDVVLTDKEYFDTYLGYPSSKSKKMQESILRKRYCLFVGSSMSDLFQMSMISNVKKSSSIKWCCFALMCLGNLSLNEKIHLIKYYRSKGIYLITVNSFHDLPKKLADLFGIKL